MKKGFTLIELLVVIAIIGVLSSIVLASLNNARANGRDAARLVAVHSLANAVYLALDANGGNFPSSGGTAVCLGTSGTCWGGNINGSASLMTLLAPFISEIPIDPIRTSGQGDRYLYVDDLGEVAFHCDNVVPYPKGPFIIWLPDSTTEPTTDTQCKNSSFIACCGTVTCTVGRFCAYEIP